MEPRSYRRHLAAASFVDMQPENDDIPARLARYAVTRDARDLWPEVSASAFRAVQREMARVTAAVLAGAPSPVRLELPGDADTRALGVAASVAGMGPLLGFWCATGRVDAQQSVRELLAQHLDHGRQRVPFCGTWGSPKRGLDMATDIGARGLLRGSTASAR